MENRTIFEVKIEWKFHRDMWKTSIAFEDQFIEKFFIEAQNVQFLFDDGFLCAIVSAGLSIAMVFGLIKRELSGLCKHKVGKF
jgi:hypothetical protein